MRIEVGEYVRLDNNKIGKVIAIEKGSIMLDIKENRWIGICCISKHSKNIIDLIEVGDYINGCLVIDIEDRNIIILQKTGGFYKFDKKSIANIKSITTHEQFKNTEYRIPEEKNRREQ